MSSRDEEGDLGRAAELTARARMGVAFTGAGVSAESGISTFRGRDGLWHRYDPYQVSSIEAFLRDPGRYWSLAAERWRSYAAARPNPGHLALAALEAAGHLRGVVTQNTDGLHRDAGTRCLVELHGNGRRVRCLDCGAIEDRAEVQARLERELPPRCGTCGGRHLKPEVVLFGEPLPARALMEAFELARGCDLMLVVGSSLQVYPAADVPSTAVERGVPLIVVNDEPTPVDVAATVVLRGRSGELLPRLEAEVRRRREAGDTAAPSRSPSSDGRGTSS
ncbi:MAG TPA: NAD-dependent deacylase [Candidatus Dormibacteraeota bacterium]|nr:NAD-dependent deacylase [Candidatus Dormibacteraeota bacterium]